MRYLSVTMKHEATVYRTNAEGGEDEIIVLVKYSYYGGCRGQRDSLCGRAGAGPALEPDEPASVEIEGAVNKVDGKAFDLTSEEEGSIADDIMDSIAENSFDYPDDDSR